jgi:hypothetical protein
MDKFLKKSLVEFILGSRKSLTLEGEPRLIAVIHEAAMSSRQLMLALETCDPEALQSALARKREAVTRFEKFTGKSWNL